MTTETTPKAPTLQDLKCRANVASSTAGRTRALFRQGRATQADLDRDNAAESAAFDLFWAACRVAR